MSTLYNKVYYLEETKSMIKDSLLAKGVPILEDDRFRDYPEKIQQLVTNDSYDLIKKVMIAGNNGASIYGYFKLPSSITSLSSGCFNGKKRLTSITASASTVYVYNSPTNMGVFEGCTNLRILGSSFNFSRMTDAYRLFYGCEKLESTPNIKFDFDSSQIYDVITQFKLSSIFGNCKALTTVGSSSTPFSIKCTGNSLAQPSLWLSDMFNGCTSLTSIDMNIDAYHTYVRPITFNVPNLVTLRLTDSWFVSMVAGVNIDVVNCKSINSNTLLGSLPNINTILGGTKPVTNSVLLPISRQASESYITSATNKGWTVSYR